MNNEIKRVHLNYEHFTCGGLNPQSHKFLLFRMKLNWPLIKYLFTFKNGTFQMYINQLWLFHSYHVIQKKNKLIIWHPSFVIYIIYFVHI